VITTILFAFIFNVAWEILQIPLYKEGVYSLQHILFCVLASLADVVMVLLIYFCFAWIYKDALWIKILNTKRVIFLMLIGSVGAVLAEIRHLSIGTWSYADEMPLIPVVHVGLSPVLQFTILPILIYSLSFKMLVKKNGIN
jgi:phosphatidylglycerophosphate synthase